MKRRYKDSVSLEHPKKWKKHHKYIIAGAIVTLLSFLLTLVPCKIVEVNQSTWGFCKLPDPFENLDINSVNYHFYGAYNNPISGLLLQFIIATFLAWGVVYLFKKMFKKGKRGKIIDLTAKRD